MSGKLSSTKLFEHKKTYKRDMAQTRGIPMASNTIVVGFYIETQEDASLFASLRDGLKVLDAPCVIFDVRDSMGRGTGGGAADYFSGDYDDDIGVTVVASHDPHFSHMLKACDAMVCGTARAVDEALRSGCVPVAFDGVVNVTNYNPVTESGNAFTFAQKNPWDIFAALVRAKETFALPFDWRGVCRNGSGSLKTAANKVAKALSKTARR